MIAILEVPLFTLGIFLSRCGWLSFWTSKLFIYLIPVSIFAKSTILWLDNEAISGTLVAIFGPILSLGYMSLFKYLYQRYETHQFLKVWKMPAKYLLPFTLVKVSLVHSSSIVTV